MMFSLQPPTNFAYVVYDALSILMVLVFADIIICNMIAYGVKIARAHPIVRFVKTVVDPLVNPLRRALPHPSRTGYIDFAPMLAIIILQALRSQLS